MTAKREKRTVCASKSSAKVPKEDSAAPTPLKFDGRPDETNREIVARKMVAPFIRHGMIAAEASSRLFERLPVADRPGVAEFANSVSDRAAEAANADLKTTSELLMAQAVSLDSIFTEYARIALTNVVTNSDASERYMRVAMKAQAGSRATLEALVRLHQPREQTVRHVHVNRGSQAIVTDEFHTHTGVGQNGKADEQPHATTAAGAVAIAALPCPHEGGDAVPIASREGEPAVQNARRQGKRRAGG